MPQAFIAAGAIVAQTDTSTGNPWATLLLFIVPLVLLFYFLLYLPRRRQQKKAEEMLRAISIGDEIRTIGGIYGTIRSEDDITYTIDLGDGTKMRIAKRAVAERIGDVDE
jgi:preprotein translocase subunit YajC